MSASTASVTSGSTAVSYWTVVWHQLRKNRVSMIALRAVVGLFAVAVAAPLLAFNVPLLWLDGVPRFPVLERMFDRSVFPSGVDVFFNLLLVVLPPALLVLPATRRGGGLRTRLASGALGLWAVVFATAAVASRSSLRVAVAVAVVGWRCCGSLGRDRRLSKAAVRAGCAGVFVLGVVLLSGPAADRWPWTDWGALARAGDVTAVFPPVPFHPDNIGSSGVLSDATAVLSENHWMGVDANQRDVLARLLFGARISLTIGIVAVSINVLIGIVLGALAGYYGRKVDLVISRFIEVMICFPTFFLILTIIAVFDSRSIFLIMGALGIVGWPGVARLVRGEFIRQRNLDYVTAAKAIGLRERRIIFRHVLPNCLGPVLVSATFGVAGSILTESGIAFLGLGDVKAPSWGQMLSNGRASQEWHLILAPGFAIFFVVTVFNLLGEGLRDALDPKLRR